MKEKISIIVPFYNVEEKLFRRCINSLINQTYKNIEIIVINDGSNKKCSNYCSEICKLSNIIKLVNQKNLGVSSARNLGIDVSTGEWIMFVDADDWLEVDACEALICKVDNCADLLISKTYVNYVNDLEIEMNNFYNQDMIIDNFVMKKELIKSLMIAYKTKYNFIATPWAKLYNKNYLVNNNINFKVGLRFGEDSLFNYECIAKAKKIIYVDYFIYHYYINNNSVTQKFDKNYINECTKLFKKYEELFKDSNIYYNEKYYMTFCFRQFVTGIKKYYLNTDNPDRKVGNIGKLKKEFKETVISLPYSRFLKKCNYSNINFKKKVLLFLLKHNIYFILYRILKF